MNAVRLASASADDMPAVLALYREAAQTEFSTWDDEYPGRQEAEGDLAAGCLYVWKEEGSLLGVISVVPENELADLEGWVWPEKAAELARFALAASVRGKGQAALVLSVMEDILRQQGYDAVRFLGAKRNRPAICLYDGAGYTRRGEVYMYGHHYIRFEKHL